MNCLRQFLSEVLRTLWADGRERLVWQLVCNLDKVHRSGAVQCILIDPPTKETAMTVVTAPSALPARRCVDLLAFRWELPRLLELPSRALALAGLVISAPAALLLSPWLAQRRKPLVDAFGRDFVLRGVLARGPVVSLLARIGLVHLFWPSWTVLRGHMAWVGASANDSRPPAHGLPAGVVNPKRLRARTGINFGDVIQWEAQYAAHQGLRTDLGMACRYALVSLWGAAAGQSSQTLQVGTVQVDNFTQSQAVDWVMRRLDTGAFLAPSQVSFVNAHCVNVAHRDVAYRYALAGSDLALADGIGLRMAGQLLGQPLRDNVNGTDMIEPLCAALARTRHRIFLLGGAAGVAQAAAEALQSRHPGLDVAGCHHGFFEPDQTARVMQQVRDAGTDLLIVAMGGPRQELFIAEHLGASGAHLGMGVGGLFDFLSERIPRAPHWVRELGAEWVWRLMQEPGRMWRRYLLGNFLFLARVIGQRFSRP